MALAPCHALFQFYVQDGRLSCQLYQRSADDFVHTFGDAHLYSNHLGQARLQLEREPLALPVMALNPAVKDLFAFRFEDFELRGYQSHPHIPAPIAV